MALSDTKIKSLKAKAKKYLEADEKGLYLEVKPNGTKRWVFRFRFLEKRPDMALGVYPDISLKLARQRRDEARELVAQGIDPRVIKKAEKQAKVQAAQDSFKAIAQEWYQHHMTNKSANHQARVKRAFDRDLFPFIGNLAIKEIDAPLVLECLRRIESRGHLELANRTKIIVGQVFRYAVATGRASIDPTPSLKGAIKPNEVKHLTSIIEPRAVGELLLAIDGYEGTPVVKAALKLSPLLFCRPGELRQLEWGEVNWQECRIEIPGAKMKMSQDHIIPLSTQAQAIIEELKPLTGTGRYIFPSARGGSRPLSENGVRTALRTMGYDNTQITPHGFRAMARTLLDEQLNYRADWIEHQLAHAVKDSNGRAYNRTTHLPQRAEMMQSWANYLDDLRALAKSGNVITASFGKAQ